MQRQTSSKFFYFAGALLVAACSATPRASEGPSGSTEEPVPTLHVEPPVAASKPSAAGVGMVDGSMLPPSASPPIAGQSAAVAAFCAKLVGRYQDVAQEHPPVIDRSRCEELHLASTDEILFSEFYAERCLAAGQRSADCLKVFVGSAKVGERCSIKGQPGCALSPQKNMVVRCESINDHDTCVAALLDRPPGAECTRGDSHGCQPGTFCKRINDDGKLDADASGRCVPARALGAACDLGEPCGPGLFCPMESMGGTMETAASPSVCRRRLSEGAVCSDQVFGCEGGTRCDGDLEQLTCQRLSL